MYILFKHVDDEVDSMTGYIYSVLILPESALLTMKNLFNSRFSSLFLKQITKCSNIHAVLDNGVGCC